MSIDLSSPLVPSMGQHDPLDGFITYQQLQPTAPKAAEPLAWPDLQAEITDMAGIGERKNWATADPLGLGGLLADTYKMVPQAVRVSGIRSARWVSLVKTHLQHLATAVLLGYFGTKAGINLARITA